MLPRIYTHSRPRVVRRWAAIVTVALLFAAGCTRIQAAQVWSIATTGTQLTEAEATHFLAWADAAKQQEQDRVLARWLTHVAQVRDQRLLGEYLEAIERAEQARAPQPPPILLAIAACESGNGGNGYSLTARNPSSSASGKYQFLNSTIHYVTRSYAHVWQINGWEHLRQEALRHAEMATMPEAVQDAAAMVLLEVEGTGPWTASSGCWRR